MTANWCQSRVSAASFMIRPGSFSQVELGGLEPPTPCLQSTHGPTGMVRDVRSRLRCVRLRPLPFGVVATGTSYREVYRSCAHRIGPIDGAARSAMISPAWVGAIRCLEDPASVYSMVRNVGLLHSGWITTDRHRPGWLLQRVATVRRFDNYKEQGIVRIAQLAQRWPRREIRPQA
jgi:hypothetical protein